MATRKEQQAQLRRQQAETDREVERFLAQLKRLLDTSLEQILGEIEDGNIEPVAALGGLLDSFRARGLDTQLAELGVLYGKELKNVVELFETENIPLELQPDLNTLEALIQFRVETAQNKIHERITSLRPAIMESIILGTRPEPRVLAQNFETLTESVIATELNTGLSAFNRTAIALQAERAGLTLYKYLGPDDDVTRPFCGALLTRDPPIYSIDEIDSMDNGQLGDVLVTGGGYNCRHQWRPISDESAREEGYVD